MSRMESWLNYARQVLKTFEGAQPPLTIELIEDAVQV